MDNSRGVLFAPWQFILFITFMALKLMGHISWSWWWVTGPLWIPLVIVLSVWVVALAAIAATDWWKQRRKEST